jgi:hypothetical protein
MTWEILAAALLFAAGIVAHFEMSLPCHVMNSQELFQIGNSLCHKFL